MSINSIPVSEPSCCDGCLYDHAPLLDAASVAQQMRENPNVLRAYLQRGGNPNNQNLLTIAVLFNEIALIELLIQHKVEIPQSILQIVQSATAFELLYGQNVEIRPETIDHYTRELDGSNSKLIEQLAHRGANINLRIHHVNRTPSVRTISYLVQFNQPKPLTAMVKAGADIHFIDPNCPTLLESALMAQTKECAIPLIVHNAPYHPYYTPHLAQIAPTFRTALRDRELHGHFPPHMRRPVGNPFPIKPFIQNCED